MNVKEVEEILQTTRANIRFYEKEGLLTPSRDKNGYRSYSEENVKQLKKIILFRKLGISIPDIKKMFDGKETVTATISHNIILLNRQMEEMKGSMDVCKRIEKDPDIDINFDIDTYWNVMEQERREGKAFFDDVKDYIEFEGNVLKNVWSRSLLYDLEGSVKKRGWIKALAIVLGICMVRGFFYHFVWQCGSFWYGFAYPFRIFLLISIITLPLYMLNRIYGEKEETEEPKKVTKRNLLLWRLLQVLGIILCLFSLIFGIPLFLEKVAFNNIMRMEVNYIITNTPFLFYMIIGLYLIFVIAWMYSNYGIFGDGFMNTEGFKSNLPHRVKKKVLAISICLFLLSIILQCTWYDCITEKGITQNHIFSIGRYDWSDISYYELSAGQDGTLQYTIIMRDGGHISLMGDSSFSNFDEKKYPRGEDDFILQLTKDFTNQGIFMKVDSWEKLHKKLTYNYWDKYAEEIRKIAGDNQI